MNREHHTGDPAAARRYLTLLERAQEGISVYAGGEIVYMNPGARKLLGLGADSQIPRDPFDYVLEEDRHIIQDLHQRLHGGEEMPESFECRIVTPEGEVRWLENRISVIDWGGRKAVLANFSDITRRKENEARLAAAGEEWHQTFDSISDFVSVRDLDYRLLRVNRSLAEFVGVEPGKLLGYPCHQVIHGSNEPPATCPLADAVATGETRAGIVDDRRSGRIFEVTISPIMGADGSLDSVVEVARDITEAEANRRRLLAAERLSGMGFIDWDLESGKIVPSQNACALFGIDAQTPPTMAELVEQRVHPDDRDAVWSDLLKAAAGEEDFDHDYRLAVPGDGVTWIHAQAELSLGSDGKPRNLLCTATDITARKEAEEARLRSNRALKVLSECNQAVVRAASEEQLLADVCRVIVEHGGYLMAWVGYAEDDERRSVRPVASCGHVDGYLDEIDITWGDDERGRGPTGSAIRERTASVVHDIAANRLYEPWREAAIERGYASSISLPLESGGRVLAALNIYSRKPDSFDAGEAELLQETANDLAYGILALRAREELARSHRLLLESEKRYRQLSDATTEAVIVHKDGRLLDVNRAFEQMFGYDREEAIGMDALELAAPESRPLVAENIRSGSETAYEATGLRSDGSTFPGIVQGRNFHFMDEPVRLVTVRDNTEQKRLERQLLQSQKMESIGQLAGGVAHDFNNYLTAIQGFIELAMMDLDDRQAARIDLEEALRAGERAAALTRQLLMFSRYDMDRRSGRIDLASVLAELESMLRRLLGERYELVLLRRARAAVIDGDANLLEQAVMNLVLNARDAMPDGGRITIAVENVSVTAADAENAPGARAGRFVRLTVSDHGAGMDQGTIEHIFEPFFSTKESKEGTGLGLSVVYGIVREHEGWVEVESEPGRGSAFHLYFPESEAPVADAGDREEKSPGGRHAGAAILLVEDEEPLRAVANKMLSHHGFRVYAAADAEEALALFEREDVDFQLAFCDVVLPGANGVELAARLQEKKPSLKIILASGYSDAVDSD